MGCSELREAESDRLWQEENVTFQALRRWASSVPSIDSSCPPHLFCRLYYQSKYQICGTSSVMLPSGPNPLVCGDLVSIGQMASSSFMRGPSSATSSTSRDVSLTLLFGLACQGEHRIMQPPGVYKLNPSHFWPCASRFTLWNLCLAILLPYSIIMSSRVDNDVSWKVCNTVTTLSDPVKSLSNLHLRCQDNSDLSWEGSLKSLSQRQKWQK